ncbi:MAG: hypothetical protein JSS82_09675 [Bacteroidetes bacterium]|nr:hypothetical protein [Bacteroidota bacterium]
MKNRTSLIPALLGCIMVFAAVLYVSCKKKTTLSTDNCANIACKNGGSCTQGFCSCPDGYELADCSKPSLSRYLGNWSMHDSIVGSNKDSLLHRSNVYDVTIKGVPGSSIDFYLDGITGNSGYYNLPCRLEDTLTRHYLPLEFRAADLYGYSTPRPMIVTTFLGVVNEGGYYIHGRYIRQYPLADSTVENDTLVYNAFKQ